MNLNMNIKLTSFAIAVALLTGCGGGGSSTIEESTQSVSESIQTQTVSTPTQTTAATSTTTTPTEPLTTNPTSNPIVTIEASNKATQSGQVKDSETGKGLANVKVSLGNASTITDENGFYTLSDLTVNEEAVVNFEKEGYVLGSTIIQIKKLSGDNTTSQNYLEYTIDTYDYQWSYDGQTEASGANIDIPANVYTDAAGDSYNGEVTTQLEIMDVTNQEGKTLFPGGFEGENTNGETVQFESYGLVSLVPKDASGNTLNFTDGSTVTLTFDTVASLDDQTVPMWYYNNAQDTWIEEGYAERQEDGTYQGEISHPGTWSLSKPLEDAPGIYRGRIVYEDGTPAQDVRISAVGSNWSSSDLSTDEDGIFEIEVVPGNSFQLVAYNYKDKYEAVHNATIPAIASGEIVEDRM